MSHLTPRIGRAGRAMLAALLAVAFASGSAASATAADDADDPSTIRWSVTPADESGPDGRTAVEHDIDPGDSVDDHFAVRNVSDVDVTFRLAAADGFYTRAGRFDMLPADQESVDSGTWISLPDEVAVPAGETVVIPFEITVPDTAEPGDHAAGITASILSVQSGDDGASVGVESRVGFRVLTRVTGEITPAAAVESLVAGYSLSWNPLRPGEMTVTFDVVNEGNTRLIAEGVVEAGGQQAAFPAEGEIRQELLPGDTRSMAAVVDDVWPLFLVPTKVVLRPIVVTMDGETATMTPVVAEVVVWAVPWPQLLLLAGVALVIGAIVWGRIRSRRRLDALLSDAREAGRREADAPVDAS
ncbi:DUF916 domain-containing protein [Microbacterium sulfonylureivorans]|uniref:DUF916 domain-containing protein n=1 Tax=Microbacterium sulfonylureivorans TaxID=2486854 RepID=UPI001F0C0C9E|nr:DUF916 domain-containing protein [Microbacterium sulfonylureivorans]